MRIRRLRPHLVMVLLVWITVYILIKIAEAL